MTPVTWPVDIRSAGTRKVAWLSEGLNKLDNAAHEWVGLFAYWMSGRSNALFPGPSAPD